MANHQTLTIFVPGDNPSPKVKERFTRLNGSLNRSGSGSTIKSDVRTVVTAPASTSIVDGLQLDSAATSAAPVALDELVELARSEGYAQVAVVVGLK